MTSFYGRLHQSVASLAIGEELTARLPSSMARSILAPPTLEAWCNAPQPDATWLELAARQIRFETALNIYVVGCRGFLLLSRKLGGPLFKIGTTQADTPEDRIAWLRECHYGSCFRCNGRWVTEDQSFENWNEEIPLLDVLPSAMSPVSIKGSSLLVRLPRSLSPKAFDEALNERLRAVAVDRWVRQEATRRELGLHGIDPDIGIRGKVLSSGLVEEVSELFFFRKKRDFMALVAIAEGIILQAVAPHR